MDNLELRVKKTENDMGFESYFGTPISVNNKDMKYED